MDHFKFCFHYLCLQLKGEICRFYLDDGTIEGKVTDVIQDLNTVKRVAGDIGLQLNVKKSELICKNLML